MSQTRDQQRFTIWEVATDWHELMVPQHIMWPSIACTNRQLESRCSQQTHHRPSHTRPSPRIAQYVSCYSFPVPLR